MSNKKTLINSFVKSSTDGVILISMSIGIFLIISIFTFFLLKLVVKEYNMSMLHTLDIKTRNLAHSALGKGIFQFKNLRNITSQSGHLNSGNYEISFDGINDENNDPLPFSHYTMLNSNAEINESKRKARIFLSSFPSGFNPAFYGENINNSEFSTSSINGGYLFKQNGDLYHNGNQISTEGIVESLPNFNNIYDAEINWTQNNVEINMSNSGANSNNKYLQFDGNDYVKINYTTTTTGTENIVLDFESGLNFGSNTWSNIPSDYKGFVWGPGDPGDPGGPNGRYISAARGNWYNTNYPSNGYQYGLSSGDNIIFNSWNEQNVYFETPDGSLFNFIKLHAAAAWRTDQRLYIKGYRNDELITTLDFRIKNTAGRWTNESGGLKGWPAVGTINNIDKIAFSNTGAHWAIDDITLTKQISVAETTLPKNNETRTISAWVRPTNNNNTWSMVQFGTGDCNGKMWGLGRRDQKLSLWGGCKDWISNLIIPKNEWSFVVLRYNGNKVRAYVNGNWQETTINGFSTQISELFIGAETTNNGSSFRSYFTGDIDEVAVWNESLTNAEILALYNNGSGRDASVNSGDYASKSNLVGYWKFNEGSGATINDASGNGKNGTKYGASWATGSSSPPQVVPLVFNAGSQLNLNVPNCGSDHTSLCTNNKIAVNQNIIFEDTEISGSGLIIATGKIILKQNSTVNGGITLIAKEIEINNSTLGNLSLFNSADGPVIIYTRDGGLISNNTYVSGLIINYDTNNSGSLLLDNSTIKGAVLNYSNNFQLNNSTNITGSVVSKYLVIINDGSSITKGDLPAFYGQNIGLSPSVVPGSYLEY